MVLTTGVGNGTDAVVRRGGGHTRRRLLATTAGVALAGTAPAGCGIFDDDPAPPPPDPLQPVLDEALVLAAAYDRAVTAQPALAKRLTPLAADHRAHVDELVRVIGRGTPSAAAPPASSAPPAPADAAGTLAALRAAERQAQRTAATAARQAPPERAALAGSVAACRASHAEALR
jgi:hypothetical protein